MAGREEYSCMSEGGLAVPHVCFGGRVLLLPWRRCLFVCAAAAGVLNGVCLPPGSVSFAFAGRQIYEVRCCAASVLTVTLRMFRHAQPCASQLSVFWRGHGVVCLHMFGWEVCRDLHLQLQPVQPVGRHTAKCRLVVCAAVLPPGLVFFASNDPFYA